MGMKEKMSKKKVCKNVKIEKKMMRCMKLVSISTIKMNKVMKQECHKSKQLGSRYGDISNNVVNAGYFYIDTCSE
ncbi:unnamed protein product [Lupinus luteus]|uniref:Uncharacterized protein n=1 Tax=Lupinus luteus TaxID=3873 RepID=A0AAV1WP92_LUPLU